MLLAGHAVPGPARVHAAKGMLGYAREAVRDISFIDDLAGALNANIAAQILEALCER